MRKYYQILYFVSSEGETSIGEHFPTIAAATKVVKVMMRDEYKHINRGNPVVMTYTIIDQDKYVAKRWAVSKVSYQLIID